MTIADTIRGLLGWPGRSVASGTPGVEGQPKEGPWLIQGANGGWLPSEFGFLNHWQMDLDPLHGGGSAIAEACIAAYAQTIAMCPGDHWRSLPSGGRERVTNSALSRILRRPNEYQSRSDFMLKLAADLYRDGNTYALAQRNDRFEVTALHPFDPRASHPLVAGNGEVFYELVGNDVIERELAGESKADRYLLGATSTTSLIVPARDVLHVKLEAERGQPLLGVPPSRHAANAVAAQRAIGGQMTQVFGNMNRPAGVIETDEKNLTQEQLSILRQRFNEAWRGIDNLDGGPPILTNGFKYKPVSMTAKDADVSTMLRLSMDEIFMIYGVPPAILGMTDRSTFSSTEALMQFWLARGLGFALNHIEVGFDHFFGLRSWPDDYVEFSTTALLRSAFKERIEGLARGVQQAIFSPNEARRSEELPDVEFGDLPRTQQQNVPLNWGGFDVQPAPAQGTEPAPPPTEEEAPPEETPSKDFIAAEIRRRVEVLHAA